MSYVSVIISGAASLGVLIGLISGIFFLVLAALKWVSRVREALYEEELRRQKKILFSNANSISSDTQDFLETRKAENRFGSTYSESHDEKKSEIFQSDAGSAKNRNENQTEKTALEKQEPNSDTIKVREFIEKMVETLIGGPLDGTTVGQLSSHSACKSALELDSSSFSQCNLKRLIKRIVSEAMTLPDMKDILCKPKTVKEAVNEDFKNKSYEDVLATAILNKVIEHFQNRENETIDYKPKPRPRSKKLNKNADDDQRSNSDWSDVSRSDQLSLTIEEYIEEVTTALEASEDERSDFSDLETNASRRIPFPEAGRTVVDGTDGENSDEEGQSSATELFTSTSSWEENWLFQKKRLRSTPNAHHPVPVPMLVPNPSEDYRALVGGVDADDLSDMSDCSDLILEDQNAEKEAFTQLSIKEVSCNNTTEELDENENRKDKENDEKEIMEGNSPEIKEESNSNFSLTNLEENKGTDVTAASEAEDECSEEEISEKVKLSSSPTSPSQQDREFSVEDFNLLQQCESSCKSESSIGTTLTSIGSENGSIRSRIAEREKEKWNNPVPLADNPYSLENIERRAQRKKNDFFRIGTYTGESIDFPEDLSSDELTKSSENLRFTRDYYINGSKNPSGRFSSSLSRHSKGHDQKSSSNERKDTFVMQEKDHETSDTQKINKKEFCLPNVKELAKQFTLQDTKGTFRTDNELNKKSESKQRLPPFDGTPGRDLELDYSSIPVSEIVSNLQQIKQTPEEKNKHVPYNFRPQTKIESCRKTSSEGKKIGATKFNGKEVHSLTARSISKEFREGLRNNSYQKLFSKINRAVTNGENEQNDVAYHEEDASPTQSINLKNMKQFWEEIITANANTTKQK